MFNATTIKHLEWCHQIKHRNLQSKSTTSGSLTWIFEAYPARLKHQQRATEGKQGHSFVA